MITYVFLDTEWADDAGRDLLSIAMVSADGRRELYIEVESIPANPKVFAVEVVIPLLDRGTTMQSVTDIGKTVFEFISNFRSLAILSDHRNDLRILRELLGDERWTMLSRSGLITTCLNKDQIMQASIDAWFKDEVSGSKKKHHALHDARALRHAWCLATGNSSC